MKPVPVEIDYKQALVVVARQKLWITIYASKSKLSAHKELAHVLEELQWERRYKNPYIYSGPS